MYDENNEKIVEGEGILLLINIDKRRAIRIPEDQYEAYNVDKNEKSNYVLSSIANEHVQH